MSKKMMLLALSVVSAAVFALPAVASANTAHIDKAEPFSISGGAGSLQTINGETVHCETVTGSGSFETTTTGKLKLTYHKCIATTPFGNLTCTSHNQASSGTITTTELPFHLIDIKGTAGVLITPGSGTHYVSFTCGGGLVNRTVTGHGVIGTITSPGCGVANKTGTLSFKGGTGVTTGLQEHTTHTGVDYHLFSNNTKAAIETQAQIHFAQERKIDCTT